MKKFKGLIPVLISATIPTVLLWLPFLMRIRSIWGIPLPARGMETIVANYDGPLYLVVAKTFYNKTLIESNFQFPLPTEYYAAHFPLFPLIIRIFGFITNYPYAMLIATTLCSIIAVYFFNKLISEYVSAKDAIFLTFVFSIFPARWLIVRSVGSADPLFVAGIIASIYYFKNKKYLLAGVWGLIAQLTKSPGILLFISFIICMLLPLFKTRITNGVKLFESLNIKKTYPLILIPIGLLIVFTVFYFTQGNFWAYFYSGDNIHLFFPPFKIFDYSAPWVGTFWLEEIIFAYLLGAIGVYKLWTKKEYEIATFVGLFFLMTLFISHRDLIRYSLPIVPFLFVAYSETLIKKEFKFALFVILIPIYLFSITFISKNVMPISNWAPFL